MMEWIGPAWDLGTRVFDAAQRRGAPLQSDDFVEFYSVALKETMAVLPGIDGLNAENVTRLRLALLQMVATVVHAYHLRKDDVKINVNYMQFEPTSDAAVAESHFCQRTRRSDSYSGFLRLSVWALADGSLPRNVLLPIEGPERHAAALPGAPRAFLDRRMVVVDDTQDFRFWDQCEGEEIRSELAAYFSRHRDSLRSFVSFPVLPSDAASDGSSLPIGVVNVQSNRRYVLGRFRGNQRKFSLLMEPLLIVLAHYLERLATIAA